MKNIIIVAIVIGIFLAACQDYKVVPVSKTGDDSLRLVK